MQKSAYYGRLIPVRPVIKVLLMTKLIFLLVTASFLQVSAEGVAQYVTISVRDAGLKAVFDSVEAQTGYVVFFRKGTLNQAKTVTFDVKNMPLKDFLEIALKDQLLSYELTNKTITLAYKPLSRSYIMPEQPVKGVLTDAATGRPLTGATITVKGKSTGATSDQQGKFNIQAEIGDVLVITYVGYQPKQLKINNADLGSIMIDPSETSLNEIVINKGYYTTSKRLNTGNVARVTSKEIEQSPVSNPLAALQARVPGLEIVQQTGVPGGNFLVRLRGTNSIANGNEPLFIIDGVPFNNATMSFNESSMYLYGNSLGSGGTSPLNTLNPSDIESIEVLKDADATAIYGSRGSNGVILITTKKGLGGPSKVDVRLYNGVGKVARKMDMLNAEQYKAMRTEAITSAGYEVNDISAPDVVVWDQPMDWQKELIGGTANTTDAQLTFSGGEGQTQFRAGAGYHRETTVFPGSNADSRISTHLSVNNTSKNNRLRTNISMEYTAGNTSMLSRDLTNLALNLPPNAPPLYTANGELNWGSGYSDNAWTSSIDHPLAYLKTSYEATTKRTLISANINYEITTHLRFVMNAGYSENRNESVNLIPLSSKPPEAALYETNTTAFTNSRMQDWNVEPMLNWSQPVGEGQLDVTLAGTLTDREQKGFSEYGKGYTDIALMKNLAAAASREKASNYYMQYRYAAASGRVSYQFRNRYILNLTGRRDGSSRFGPANRFANFGALGAAWIFSDEPAIQEALPFLSFGKLRGSYGTAGNDLLKDYEYLDTYTSSIVYLGVVGLTPVRMANPDFAWEINRKLEVAMEFGFLKDRITGSVAYYRNRSSNQLVGNPLPPAVGFGIIQSNFPAVVENRGVEIELSSRIMEHRFFKWNAAFNMAFPRNELVSFPGLSVSSTYANTLVVGMPLTILKRAIYLGVDPQTGFYQFEDVDKSGTINYLDRVKPVATGQRFSGGMQHSFQYKNFQMDMLLQFVKQTGVTFFGRSFVPGGLIMNAPSFVLDRWQKPGDQTDIQRFSILQEALNGSDNLSSSDRQIGDASFIRLKNLSFGYNLPKAKMKVFVLGQNLLTFTNYLGLDPETGSFSLPPLRVLAAGLQVTF